jgi:hypothetical protein
MHAVFSSRFPLADSGVYINVENNGITFDLKILLDFYFRTFPKFSVTLKIRGLTINLCSGPFGEIVKRIFKRFGEVIL